MDKTTIQVHFSERLLKIRHQCNLLETYLLRVLKVNNSDQ